MLCKKRGCVSCVALKIQYDLQTFSQEVDCFFEMQNLNDRKKFLAEVTCADCTGGLWMILLGRWTNSFLTTNDTRRLLWLIEFIDFMVFNAIFNSISVISQRSVHLSTLSWSSFNQYSAQYSFKATGCFPTY